MPIEELKRPDRIDEDRIEKLKDLFPEAFGDGKLNLEILKSEIESINETLIEEKIEEFYGLQWVGKQEARKISVISHQGTLKFSEGEGIREADTQNILIEGDNLEVLRILQKSYYRSVKMIYCDPPYNTGNDFIYKDDFKEPVEKYLQKTGQADEEGLVTTNPKAGGRFHANWLSMMYPRLRLARNLLRDDGLIVIQIDDNELHNLIQLMNEIYGEENFVSTICVKMSHLSGMKMSHKDKKIPKIKEFIVIYAKNRENIKLNPVYIPGKWKDVFDRYTKFVYKNSEECKDWKVVNLSQVIKEKGLKSEEEIEKFCIDNAENIFRTAVNDSLKDMEKDNIIKKVITKTGLEKYVLNREEILFASSKLHVIDGKKVPAETIGDIWTDIGINNLHNEGGVDFPNGKKPLKLIKRLVKLISNDNDDIIMDFFAGSGTTGHAVLEANVEDNLNRRFILIQIPEKIDNVDYPTIVELTKERLRRSIQMINEKNEGIESISQGFKVFQLAGSNLRKWENYSGGNVEKLTQNVDLFTLSPFNEMSTHDDIVMELMLNQGFPLDSKIDKDEINSNNIWVVQHTSIPFILIVCLDEKLHSETAKFLASTYNKGMLICLDNSLSNEQKIILSESMNVKTI
jgi:adenine-specific DNA-methyltransferase